jgi:diadenosine tetraphosphate (Ap4A) HIT family hydrolase
MAIIYTSKNFTVAAEEHPLIDRDDGGHITITPIMPVSTRQQLTPRQAIELMRLTVVVGEAMHTVMNRHGVDIGRINYQDNGNWSVFKPEGPLLHIHLYGRAKSAKYQRYGHACYFPHRLQEPAYYESFRPLTQTDVSGIKQEITLLLIEEKFSDAQWRL